MKVALIVWLFIVLQASALPSYLLDAFSQQRSAKAAHQKLSCPFAGAKRDELSKRQAPSATPPFDANLQYVSTSGAHAFEAPSGNDQRGPCPGLNAMANHGYMPRNGVGTLTDFIDGTAAVFGMGTDLSSFLAVYGAVFDGDLTKYSIGGPVNGLLNLGGLLGAPQGLSGSHNKYEGDVSPTRGDLYQYGNDYLLQLSQFAALYDLGQQNGDNVDLDVLTSYRATRFQESVSRNPYFFNAPFSGVLASPAAWSFIYRFMANKSAEHPEGRLTGDVLKSFYAVSGGESSGEGFSYSPGHERIPENWYTRHPTDSYTIPYLSVDTVSMALQHPEFLSVGGNTGTVNTFTGIDPEDLTQGVFNAQTLLQGNNALCFGFQAGLQEAPDILSGLFTDIDPAMDKLGAAVSKATDGLGCPELNAINKGQFGKYPGWTRLRSDGTYG
ncbi:MAG: hypothetical protein LQ342_004383 [Letrouitia transgressa]|nr:MAG: hypothetical protein LQ342_004383 [Letrouitia transgressa]